MLAFCDPYFLVYGQNRIRRFVYMDRILEFVHMRENKGTILSIYGKIRIRKSTHFGAVLCRGFPSRYSTKISLCLKIARYKEVSAINKFTIGKCYRVMNLKYNNFPLIGLVCAI